MPRCKGRWHVCLQAYLFDREEAAEKTAAVMGALIRRNSPLLVLTEEGRRGIYSCVGYHVGSVDLILQIFLLRKKDGKEGNDDNINRKAE